MKSMFRTLSVVAALVATTAIASAQGRDVPAPKKTEAKAEVDYKALAQKRIASWQETKVECYRVTGAQEGQHWRVNPNNPGDIQTHSSMWSLPPNVLKKVADCKAGKKE